MKNKLIKFLSFILILSTLFLTLTSCGKKYEAQFIADGKIVDTVTFKKRDKTIDEPSVPEKPGYTGRWEDYELEKDDIEIYAIYSPITYTATFKADGVVVGTDTFVVTDAVLTEPSVPEKEGYTGRWESYTIGPNNLEVNAIYSETEYSVTFKADDKVVSVEKYSLNNKNITEPNVPEKEGYTGSWESYTLTSGNIIVNAVYEPITYTVTFMADGTLVQAIPYTFENKNITEPAVPAKVHYNGVWEYYELNGNITVNAVYDPIQYKVEFIVDGNVIKTEYYSVEDKNITEGKLPEKPGYTGSWENYTLTTGDVKVNAVYELITYTITFMADGTIVAEIPFTVENKNITEPDVPTKRGCTGSWESYELGLEDITVNAIYTTKDVVVTFVLNYEGAINETRQTVNGLIDFVPTRDGYEFNGWWKSLGSTTEGYILSEKYDTTQIVIEEDLILYAEWILISDTNTKLPTPVVSINNNVFSWNPVNGAQYYDLIVVYNSNYSEPLLEATIYDTSWTLPNEYESGQYVIRLRAHGDGINTINSEYVTKYYRQNTLDSVYGLNFDLSNSILTWNKVQSAEGYNIYVNSELVDYVTACEYDFSTYQAGTYSVRVEAVKPNWVSGNGYITIDKRVLLSPTVEVSFDQTNLNYVFNWNDINYANEYIIYLNGVELTRTNDATYSLSYTSELINGLDSFNISVVAFNNNADYFESETDNEILVNKYYKLEIENNTGLSKVTINGKETNVLYIPSNETAIVTATPASGYSFDRWESNSEIVSTDQTYEFVMAKADSKLLPVFAYYTLYTYMEDYNAGEITEYHHMGVTAGTTVKLTATVNYGYVFLGWYLDGELLSTDKVYEYVMPKANTSIEAKYVCYRLTTTKSHTNAGTISTYNNKIVAAGEVIGLNATVNNGYTFGGWYLDGKLLSTERIFDFEMPASDALLEARYIEHTVTLHYIYNGVEIKTEEYTNSLPITEFYQKELQQLEVFVGWYKTPTFSSVEYIVTSTLELEVVDNHAYIYGGSYFGSPELIFEYDKIEEKYIVKGNQEAAYFNTKLIIPGEFNGIQVYKAESIRMHGYNNNAVINDVEFSYGIEIIGKSALSYVDTLQKITLPDSLITIEEEAFRKSVLLETINLPKNLEVIGVRAFCECTKLYGVFFEEESKIKEIQASAFELCPVLDTFEIPASLTKFGSNALGTHLDMVCYQGTIEQWAQLDFGGSLCNPMYYATKFAIKKDGGGYQTISRIVIPGTVKTIGRYTFCGFDFLEEVVIEEGVETISMGAFSGNKALTSIQLPESLKEIGSRAFEYCDAITLIKVPSNVEKIDVCAFLGCTNLETLDFGLNSKIKLLPTELIYNTTSLVNLTIPNVDGFTEKIGLGNNIENIYYQGTLLDWFKYEFSSAEYNPMYYAEHFYYLENGEYVELTSLTIPESITDISAYAFYGFENITELNLHRNIKSVGERAFSGHSAAELVILKEIETIGNYAFGGSSLRNLTIEKYNSTIADYAYTIIGSVAYIETLTVESGLLGVGDLNKFASLVNLSIYSLGSYTNDTVVIGGLFGTSVTDASKYYTVSQKAASTTNTYKTFYIPNTLKSVEVTSGYIYDDAFKGLSSLTKVSLGSGIQRVDSGAFENCSNVSEFYYNVKALENAEGRYSSFGKNNGLTVYIGDDVETIPEYFMGSTHINYTYVTSVIFGENSKVKKISKNAFAYCDNLTSIVLPDSIETIEENAFQYCTRLTKIVLPANLTSLGKYAFDNNSLLKEVVINDLLAEIPQYAFSTCTQLTKLTLGKSLSKVAFLAFTGDTKLYDVYYNGDVVDWCNIEFNGTEIQTYADELYFKNAQDEYELVKDVVIPESVTELKNYVFSGYKALSSIELHDKLTSIGKLAFDGCENLLMIYIYDSTTVVESNAFRNCKNLTIYCEAESLPTGWKSDWNPSNRPVVFNAGSIIEHEGMTYSYDELSKELELIIAANKYNIIIPSQVEYNGSLVPVTSINQNAFNNVTSVYAIMIPSTVITVPANSFSKLSNVVFFTEHSVAPTNFDASWNNNNTVHYGYNTTDFALIDDVYYKLTDNTARLMRFANDNAAYEHLDTITYLNNIYNVTSIENGAFKGNTTLTSMKLNFLGESATTNNFFAYLFGGGSYGSYSLVPKNITTVEITGNNDIADYAFYSCGSIKTIILSDDIKALGNSSFYHCSSLTSINIPSGVTTLPASVLEWTGLKTFELPAQITQIEAKALAKLYSLTSLTVHPDNEIFDSRNNCNAIVETATNKIIVGHEKTVYDETITAVAAFAFYAASKYSDAQTLVIPDTITQIDPNAYSFYAQKIYNLTIPFIGENKEGTGEVKFSSIFGTQTKVVKVIVTGDTTIGINAFNGQSELKEIIFQGSASLIDYQAFYNCTKLTTVQLPKGLTTIGTAAFYSCIQLAKFEVPASVETIGHQAFYYCTALKTITLNEGLVTIGPKAFEKCSALTSITTPNSLRTIGESAFTGCNVLASVTLKEGLETINEKAFENCVKLTEIKLPNGLTTIGTSAFTGCTGLTKVYIPSSVTSMAGFIFSSNTTLTIYYQGSEVPTEWNKYWNSTNRPIKLNQTGF